MLRKIVMRYNKERARANRKYRRTIPI